MPGAPGPCSAATRYSDRHARIGRATHPPRTEELLVEPTDLEERARAHEHGGHHHRRDVTGSVGQGMACGVAPRARTWEASLEASEVSERGPEGWGSPLAAPVDASCAVHQLRGQRAGVPMCLNSSSQARRTPSGRQRCRGQYEHGAPLRCRCCSHPRARRSRRGRRARTQAGSGRRPRFRPTRRDRSPGSPMPPWSAGPRRSSAHRQETTITLNSGVGSGLSVLPTIRLGHEACRLVPSSPIGRQR